jgi:putative DNA primase/helicase
MEILDNSAAVRDALQCLSPDLPYEDWRNVGFALISEFGKEQGGEMFDNWSQAGSKYDAAAVRAVIKSADPNGTIKIATLFHLAKQYGYQPSSSGKSQDFINRNPIPVADKTKTDSEAQERLVTASKAQNIWEQADRQVSPDMPYVSRKKITPTENLREIALSKVQSIIGYWPKSSGEPLTGDTVLVAPVWMFTEDGFAVSNVELIDGDSRKAALSGRGTKKGGFWPATSLPEGDGAGITILIGEGVATVLSAQHATGYYAVADLLPQLVRNQSRVCG